MAQLVIAAAGAAIGFAIGGPTGAQIGFTIGSAIGAPTQKQKGPRLEDLKVSGTEYGQTIPYCEGVIRTAGQVVWASDRREIATTTEQGGKGGGVESTTYTYEVDLLYLLTDNTISGVLRVWNNGKLIFTNLDDATFDSVEASNTSELWDRFTVYTGDATQMPDPTYEAAVTTAYASAYRGRGSVFIESLQLGGNGQIPNLTFEIANGDGTVTYAYAASLTDLWTVPNTGASGYATPFAPGELPFINNASGATIANVYLHEDDSIVFRATGDGPTAESPAAIASVGVSDDPCLCVTQPSMALSNQLRFGYPVTTRTYSYASKQARPYCFAVRGDVVVFSNRDDLNLDKFSKAGGYPTASTVAGTYIIKQIALTSTRCYALTADDTTMYEFDVSDMSLLGSYPGPAAGDNKLNAIMSNDDDDLYCIRFDDLYKFNGVDWDAVATFDARIRVQGGSYSQPYMVGNSYFSFHYEGGAVDLLTRADIRYVSTPAVPTLEDVVSRLLIRSGLDASQFDVSALASITTPVRSMAVSQVTPIRTVLETLASAYFFSCVLSDKLYFYPDGGSSVATIDYADLGAGENQAKDEPLELRMVNDLEIPAQIALSYSNVLNDYNVATEYSDRLLTSQGSTTTVGLPLGFRQTEAKAIADKTVQRTAAEIFTTTLDLLSQYTKLEPTDIVTVTDDDGSTYRLKLTKRTESVGVLSFEAVLDNASVLVAAGTTSGDYSGTTEVTGLPDTLIEVIDGPLLRDADNRSPGVYVSAKGKKAGWPGCLVQMGYDGTLFEEEGTIASSGVIGRCTTTLAGWSGGNRFDEINTVTVNVGLGVLSSVTRDQVLDSGANACKIGDEVLQFRVATFVSTGVYTLSGLLRGRRGTEWAMADHAMAERFVLLSADSLRRVDLTASDIDAVRYFRGITLGRRVSTATTESLTYAGIDLKPFAPVNLRLVKTGESDPLFSSVALLVRGNGADGSIVFQDISPLTHTLTRSGTPAVSTAQSQYNGASISFDGTGDYITVTRQAGDFDFGTDDFCVEAWIYTVEAGRQQTIMTTHPSTGLGPGFLLYVAASNVLAASCWGPTSGTSLGSIAGATTVTLDTWHHVAYTRNGSTFTLWLDGVSQGTVSSASAVQASNNNMLIGRDPVGSTRDWNGYMQELRATKGYGTYRYASGFTPTGPWPTTSSADGVSFTWDRRTRLDKNFTTGVTPLGETTEAYEIDVYDDGTFTTVVRTLTSTTETVNYSEAQQIADFGGAQTNFYIDVYQVSAMLGRGYPVRGSF